MGAKRPSAIGIAGTVSRMKRAFICLALVAASYTAFGQADLLGVWKGKASLDVSKLPKAKSPQAQKQMDAGIAQLKKMVVVLTLKKGGTYLVTVTGAPGATASQNEEGTWKLDKTTLTTTATKQNGKPPRAGEKPQKLTYDKAKKTLSMKQEMLSMVFTK